MLEIDRTTGCLAPGTHPATLQEVERVFGDGVRRRQIIAGLRFVVTKLVGFGVETIWLDGSFVTTKLRPNDVDVVYVPPVGADTSQWGILAFARRTELKKLHMVDLWPHPSPQPTAGGFSTVPLIDWFRGNRDGTEKGVVELVARE